VLQELECVVAENRSANGISCFIAFTAAQRQEQAARMTGVLGSGTGTHGRYRRSSIYRFPAQV